MRGFSLYQNSLRILVTCDENSVKKSFKLICQMKQKFLSKTDTNFWSFLFVCFKGRIESVFAEFTGLLMTQEAIEMVFAHVGQEGGGD